MAKKSSAAVLDSRKKVYPKLDMREANSKDPITEETAKKLLGWREAEEKEQPLLTDHEGKKIVCTHNLCNRPFNLSDAYKYAQEILNGRWEINGETISIGWYGNVLSGQHRLIATILAAQLYRENPTDYPFWEKEPYLVTIIVFGVSEDDKVVNTIDTGRPRSLSDVIFRSDLFSDIKTLKDKKELSRIAEFAVRFLWNRTGVDDALSLKRTHAESLDFLAHHKKILKCVRHIHEENEEDGSLQLYTKSLGTASGLMYLMSCCKSDLEKYKNKRQESSLDFSTSDKAEAFWTELGHKAKTMRELRTQLGIMANRDASSVDRAALITKGWLSYVAGKPMTENSLALKFTSDDDGYRTLIEFPTVGGIDLGNPKDRETEEESPPVDIPDDKGKAGEIVSTETVKKTTVPKTGKTDEKPAPVKKGTKKTPPKGKVTDEEYAAMIKGKEATYVYEENGGHWQGFIASDNGKTAEVIVAKPLAGYGTVTMVKASQLRKEEPKE